MSRYLLSLSVCVLLMACPGRSKAETGNSVPAILTKMSEVKTCAREGVTNAILIELEGRVVFVDPSGCSLVLEDESGRDCLELDFEAGLNSMRAGERVRLSGTARFVKGRASLKVPPLVIGNLKKAAAMINLSAGLHSIRVDHRQTAYRKGLDVQYAGPDFTNRPIPPSALFHSPGTKSGPKRASGVAYSYFDGIWRHFPNLEQLVPIETGVLTNFTISPTNWSTEFAVRFDSHLHIEKAGRYTFEVLADDYARLFIDREQHLPKVAVIEAGTLREPLPMQIGQLVSDEDEWQWAETEGTVTFVGEERGELLVELTNGNEILHVKAHGATLSEWIPLLNCRVSARGVVVPAVDAMDRKVFGVLMASGRESLQIRGVPRELWANVPALTSFPETNAVTAGSLVQVQGTVSRVFDRGIMITTGDVTVMAESDQIIPATLNAAVKAVGYVQAGNGTVSLAHSFYEVVRDQPQARDKGAQLPLLTFANQVYSLSSEEASRMYPVRIKGVVTSPILRVQDATRGIYLSKAKFLPDFAPIVGEIYEVHGDTAPGLFAPVLKVTNVTFVGHGTLPRPIRPTYDQLMSQSDCAQWAELEGVIQSAMRGTLQEITNTQKGDLLLATKGGVVLVSVGGAASAEWARSMENARVRVRGVIGARTNPQRQNLGGYLSVPSPAYVCVVQRGPADPFAAPLVPVARLKQFRSQDALFHRVRIKGQVTRVGHGHMFYVMDETDGIAVRARVPVKLAVGDLVEVCGYQDLSATTLALGEAVARKDAAAPLPQPPLYNVDELITGSLNLARVRLNARVVAIRTNGTERLLEMNSGVRSFHARQELNTGPLPLIQNGSLIELTGICAGRMVVHPHGTQLESFDVLLNSPADVRLVEPPPRWTIREALIVIGCMAGCILLAVLWISLLRGRVEERTRKLREEIESHKKTEAELEAKTRQLQTEIEERKRIEKDAEIAHKELVQASRLAGMADVATGVLHNVGNVLNTANVSVEMVSQRMRHTRLHGLSKLVGLIKDRGQDFSRFVMEDPAGKMIPGYLCQLEECFKDEQKAQEEDLQALSKSVEHIKQVVAMQQTYAKSSAIHETVLPDEVIEDAFRLQSASLSRHSVELVREFEPVPSLVLEKHKLLQILVNLLSNAKYACDADNQSLKRITVRLQRRGDRVAIEVSDNGIGISPENLNRIFTQGFTTRLNGHGFGLHSCALAAREMGAILNVQSAGPGCGATFTIELPLQPPPPKIESDTPPQSRAEPIANGHPNGNGHHNGNDAANGHSHPTAALTE